MKLRFTRLPVSELLVLATPFMSGVFFRSPIGNLYFFYVLLFAYLVKSLLQNGTLVIPRAFLWAIAVLVPYSIIGSLVFSTPLKYLISYMPPIILTFVAYHAYIRDNQYDVESIFQKYYAVSVWFAAFAMMQQALHLVGSDALFYFSNVLKVSGPLIGVTGLSSEPSNFAVAMMPATFYALHRITIDRRIGLGALLVIAAQLMSFSSLGYLGVFISASLLAPSMFGRRTVRFLIIAPFAILAASALINTEFFARRLSDTWGIINGSGVLRPGEVNLSTYTLLVNYDIVKTAFWANFPLGTGIGSYYEVFSKYIGNYFIPSYRDSLPGSSTAASFLLKITAELGLVGLVGSLYLLFRNFSFTKNSYINSALFVTLLIIYLRMGMYFINGIPFFILLYVYSAKTRSSYMPT